MTALLPQYATRRVDDDIEHLIDTIQHADALDLLARLPDASVDLIITDPPYGIGRDKGMGGAGGGIIPRDNIRIYDGSWDNKRPPPKVFDEILRVSKCAVIFGGNYFSDLLPQSNHWIVWDKLVTMPSYSKCELIWTNANYNTVQKIERKMNGMIGGIRDRVHPTQKPVDLVERLITLYSDIFNLVCDPFAGSGTTAVAARKCGRRFICGDNHLPYVGLARQRLQRTDPYQATPLANGQTQLSLFEAAS